MTTDLERTILQWIRDHRSRRPAEGVSVSETNLTNRFPSLEDQRVIDRMLAEGRIVRDDSNGWDRIRIPEPACWRVFVNGENTGWTASGVTPVQAVIDFLVDRGEPKYGCGGDGFTITVVPAAVRELR